MAKSGPVSLLAKRQQVAEAAVQGFLDSALAADLSTAKTNGYVPGQLSDVEVGGIIGGVNR